jgi:phage terminase large subunit-like protein
MLPSDLDNEVRVDQDLMRRLMADSKTRREYSKLDFVELAPQQMDAINSPARYTIIQAGNQSGKTHAGAVRTALVALRRNLKGSKAYKIAPPRTDGTFGTIIWCLSTTNQMVRDGVMLKLLGDVGGGRIGTGLLPGDRIVSYTKSHALVGLVDTVIVRADDGSLTAIRFKSYDQSREAMQSESVAFIWADELLNDEAQWNELLARGTACSGAIFMTATPKRQQSPVMRWFKGPGHSDRKIIRMSARKTIHLTEEQWRSMEQAYSPLERASRMEGDEYAGGGLVLQVTKDMCGMKLNSAMFNPETPRILGIDPHHSGLSVSADPTALLFGCYNPDGDILYVVNGFKQQYISPESVAFRVKKTSWANAPCAWGRAEKQGTANGQTFAQLYYSAGLRMLPKYATLPGGGLDLDLEFDEIQRAFINGNIKINVDLFELWDEIAGLERDENNKIIERHDHFLAALRYMYLCRKQARRSPPTFQDDDPFADIARRAAQPTSSGGDFNLFATGYDYSDD